jgi:hypothetical protein
VYTEVGSIVEAYEKDNSLSPLLINEDGVPGEVARRKLSGEPLQKILIEVLKIRVGYPEITIPPFNVIKGV